MSEKKRVRFDDCQELKTELGSLFLRSLAQTALQHKIRDAKERLILYEDFIQPENQCCACQLPVDKDEKEGIVRCKNDGIPQYLKDEDNSSLISDEYEDVKCLRVIKCSWEHCPGVSHHCHICKRYACGDTIEFFKGVDECEKCERSTCVNCFSRCEHKECAHHRKCQQCSPVVWPNDDDQQFCEIHKVVNK